MQIKFCLCISFLEKEMNSAAPFALKKMLMLPRLNLCWRYYKRLQFLPPKHSLPYAIGTFFLRTETFFSASPFFYLPDPCSSSMSRNIELAEQASGLSAVPWRDPPPGHHRLFLPAGRPSAKTFFPAPPFFARRTPIAKTGLLLS